MMRPSTNGIKPQDQTNHFQFQLNVNNNTVISIPSAVGGCSGWSLESLDFEPWPFLPAETFQSITGSR